MNNPELYNIFNFTFKMLKDPSHQANKLTIGQELIKFLQLLRKKNDYEIVLHDFTQEFCAWLAVKIFTITLDGDLTCIRDSVVESFLEVLEIKSLYDPLILTETLSTFFESINQSLESKGSYYKPKDEPLFFVKHLNVGNLQPESDDQSDVINVDHDSDIQKSYLFFILMVERCINAITEMDQIYTFEILNLMLRFNEFCSRPVKDKTLILIPRLLLNVLPANFVEWDTVHSCFGIYHERIRQSNLNTSHIDSLFNVISYIINNLTGVDEIVTEIMFSLCLEVPYVFGPTNCDTQNWVNMSIKLLPFINFNEFNFDSFIHKLVDLSRKEFFPFIEAYILKAAEVDVAREKEQSSFVMEQKIPAWKLCLNILDKVSTISYSATCFESLLDYAALIVSSGQKIAYVLRLKYPDKQFQLYGSRNLRPLSVIPYISNECFLDFSTRKYASLIRLTSALLNLFAECEVGKLQDNYLIQHIFVIFTLPWNEEFAHDFPLDVKLSCLDGLLNLTYILSEEKTVKYVKIIVSGVYTQILKAENPGNVVMQKFFSLMIFWVFAIPLEETTDIIETIKTYLMPDKVDVFLLNEFVNDKLLCFLSNRCVVKRGPSWQLLCFDCDSAESQEIPEFALVHFSDYVAIQFLNCLQDEKLRGRNAGKCFVRFGNHSHLVRDKRAIEIFFNFSLRSSLSNALTLNEIICNLAFSPKGDLNKEAISTIYSTLCSFLVDSSQLDIERETKLITILEVTKNLLRLPYPCEMSIFKILTLYYLPNGIDVFGVRVLFKLALSSRGKELNDFCRCNEPRLAKFIVDFMIHRNLQTGDRVGAVFTEIINILGCKIGETLSSNTLISCIITEIIKVCDSAQSSCIISELASLFTMDMKSFLIKHYEHVFSDIYSLDDERIASENLVPLFESCGIDLETSSYDKYSQLVSTLMLNCKHPLKIFRFLFHSEVHQGVENAANLLDDLKQHFIGCLTVIESALTTQLSTTSVHTAKKYIRCISNFVKILGFKTVATIQVKLLTTLRTCLPLFYESLPKHCLKTWVYFCFSVDLQKIGPYLPTILIHILPLIDKFPDTVANIFYYFIVQNAHNFRNQLPQLSFVPCHPHAKMQQVWCAIQTSILGRGDHLQHIVTTLENVYCESTETKIVALEHLRVCLKDYSTDMISSMKNSDSINPIFELILTCLLDNINNKNNDVRILCGACLGELGAIDPMKFGFNDSHKTYTPQKYNLNSDDFSVLCITKIVHCLGKSDESRTTGILYSTIQELLRLQLLNKTEEETLSYFGKFSVQDQHVLQPLLQTKYIFKGVKMERNSSNAISFGYHTIKTPCEWATIWASQMLARMPPSFQKTVFTTCLPAMRIDTEVMETVLPYILLYALLHCENTEIDLVEKEMKYILQWDLSKHRTKPDNNMIIVGESAGGVIHSDVTQTKYVAIILDLLDFINQTASDCYFFEATLNSPNEDQVEAKLKEFVQRFSPCAMSWKSFVQKDHCRALYYIEKSTADDTTITNFKPLRNIYSKLNDVDGLVGVAKSSPCVPTMEETMINHLVYGATQDALSGYERLCSKYKSTDTYRGLIQCYIDINQSSIALAVSSQIMNDDKYLKPEIFSEHIESLWSASKYDETDSIFEELGPNILNGFSWSVDLVGIYRLLTKPNYTDVLDKIKSIRLGVINSLCDLNKNGMNLYRQGYWYMVKLHLLNDIEALSQLLFSIPPKGGVISHGGIKEAWDYFDKRLSALPSHGPYIKDVRKSHLQVLDIVFNASKDKLNDEEINQFSSHLGMLWLDSAKRARKKRCYQDAYTCIGIADKYSPSRLFIELAKYYQAKSETDSAVLVLQQGLTQNPHLLRADNNSEACQIYAKAKLLTASFNVSSMNLDFNDGYTAFKEAAEICNLEKSFVCLASYLYNQHLTEAEPDNTAAKRFIQLDSARNFSKSLLYGTKHIYQSMPCMLSLWLDYGARIAKKLGGPKKAEETGMMKTLKDFNGLMENNLLCLPTYMFMTAFSQILSRINHRQSSCFDILKLIITQIVQDYYQQAMWSFISVCRSNNAMQKRRTEEICRKIKASSKHLSKFFRVFNEFTDKLIDVSLKRVKYSKKINLSQLNPHLKMLISSFRNVPIMLPLQRFLTVQISSSKNFDKDKQHTPFPLTPVYISDVKEEVLMLFSVQMPKRLEFVGSDGEVYPLMCKKDDLRLDSRIMEFNSVINLLLRMDSVAHEKDLSIRTYSVVPLNAECGIIEWLSGLTSLKGIITDMYSKFNVPPMPVSQIKKLMLVQKDEVELSERLRRFVDVILPKHPPVLHKWFFERHPSPDAWYHCRNSFVKSAAVMSIVGYIVGLGDRHGENILLDSKTGEAVHVDFNCLFNRSDFLTYPETVPFRLTHSMVRAMGSTGIEGLFVTSCEMTNRVIRHNSDQLLSIMKPFLYDIDVKSFNPRKGSIKESNTSDDMSNDEAKANIQNIEMRLNGVVRSKNDQFAPHRNSKPLSVEGQTRMLIKEATSNLNLCQMFAGWAPYM